MWSVVAGFALAGEPVDEGSALYLELHRLSDAGAEWYLVPAEQRTAWDACFLKIAGAADGWGAQPLTCDDPLSVGRLLHMRGGRWMGLAMLPDGQVYVRRRKGRVRGDWRWEPCALDLYEQAEADGASWWRAGIELQVHRQGRLQRYDVPANELGSWQACLAAVQAAPTGWARPPILCDDPFDTAPARLVLVGDWMFEVFPDGQVTGGWWSGADEPTRWAPCAVALFERAEADAAGWR